MEGLPKINIEEKETNNIEFIKPNIAEQSDNEIKKETSEEKENLINSKKDEILKIFENKKEGVDLVFEENPELIQVGTKEQYKKYLDSIFPHSKVKDIVNHWSWAADKIKNDKFKKLSEVGSTGAGELDAIYFTKSTIPFWGGEKSKLDKISAVLNIQNPLSLAHLNNNMEEDDLSDEDKKILGEYRDIMDQGYDTAFQKNKKPSQIDIAVERSNKFENKGYDSVLHPELSEIAVFNPNQIHIIGSEADLNGFKKFVEKNKK